MEFLKEFISQYGTTIAYAIFTAVFAYLGVKVKAWLDKYLTDHTKRAVVKTVVQAIEQMYKDIHGEEKLNRALVAISEMLEDKGISITELEMRMLIEASVAEFNKAFEKKETDTKSTEAVNPAKA